MDKRTADDVEAELAARGIPGEDRTWLDVAREATRAQGALLSDVCAPGGRRRPPSASRALYRVWATLRGYRYSLNEIARPWGVHHTTVHAALHKLQEAA